MTGWPRARLGDLCEIQIGRTPPRAEPRYWGPGYPWLSIADMNQGRELFTTKETITEAAVRERNCRAVPAGTLVFSFKLSVGKVGFVRRDMFTNEAIAALRVRDDRQVRTGYLYHALAALDFRGIGERAVKGVTLNTKSVANLRVPLPPLDEQRRIAAVLDKADEIRRKPRESLRLFDEFSRSTFLEMFGDPVRNEKGWEVVRLERIADIVSGVTKGRRLHGESIRSVPYLRVANVQDGYLDLSEVKPVEATADEVAQYQLRLGDILLTEGGDPDKLGRGAVWRGEIEECIHQNHIFRARLKEGQFMPEYVSALLGSGYGKRYFFKAAKQTTGIASINRRQLGAFPVLRAPVDVQQRYAALLAGARHLRDRLASVGQKTDDLIDSLARRAFRGEL